MISAVAFACVSSDGVAVSGIEFTPELKASLGLSALGSLIGRPLNDDAIGTNTPSSNAVKQHLQRVHTTAARIELPPLSIKRNRALCEITDVLINFDCLGVCFHEFEYPEDTEFRTSTRDQSSTALTAPLTTGAIRDERTANGFGVTTHHSPFGIIKNKPHDPLRYSRTFGRDRVLRIISRYKIRAVMLVEPPDHGRESLMCLYTNPDGSDEIERAFQYLSSALRV